MRQSLIIRVVSALILATLPCLQAPAANSGLDQALSAGGSKDEFLPPEQAFRLSAEAAGPDRVALHWVIAPGYYLYRERLKFAPGGEGVTLGKPDLPAGENHTDEFFGTQIVYRETLDATLPLARSNPAAVPLALNVTYQGCADAGLCYPPQTAHLTISLPAGTTPGSSSYVSEQDAKANVIRNGSLGAMLALFFLSGLGLAFTGCVLPTVPILSGIIVGHGHRVTTARAFLLSLTYVLGMAFTYTVAGALTAASGLQVQAIFQQPWIVLLFAALFVAMAASMFGAFTLQMPAFIQTRLAELSNRQRGGHFGGVAIMGALSALIITACVAPAMIAALAVISQSGNVWRGAAALFAMSLGMGAPLLVVGASAGRLLPRAGAWMDDVKRLAGCMMLGVAAWMLARLVSDRQALLLYAIPVMAALLVLWRFAVRGTTQRVMRGAAVACGLYAAALVYGFAQGSTDPLHPLAGHSPVTQAPEFRAIQSLADLDREVAAATAAGKPVVLDFYADWCVSCKEMERYTFSNRFVRERLAQAVLLRADVTANSPADQALLKRFGIFGPPTIAFYNARGVEQAGLRVVGYMKAPAFIAVLQQVIQ